MPLEIELIGNFNPFEWDDLKCPVCGKNKFASLSHSSIYCDHCNARFVVRHTCGDPGCVIDCIVEEEGRHIYAPEYRCTECLDEFFNRPDKPLKFGSLEDEPKCPNDPEHKIERVEHIFTTIEMPEDFPKRFYLILKTGDYCSGWMDSGVNCNRLDHPTQEEWNEFQKKIEEPEVIVLPRAIIVKSTSK